MRIRTRLGNIASAGLIIGISTIGFAGVASADQGSNGTIIPITVPSNAANQTDIQNDEPVQFVIPNGDLSDNEKVNVYECDDPSGNVTMTYLETLNKFGCDTQTNIQFTANAQGGLTTPNPATDPTDSWVIYSLPNGADLGESTSNATCDSTDECIVYIGPTTLNPYDGSGVVYSQPFFVDGAYDYEAGNQAPGTPTPEVPYIALLPLAAAGLLGGAYVINRSRKPKFQV